MAKVKTIEISHEVKKEGVTYYMLRCNMGAYFGLTEEMINNLPDMLEQYKDGNTTENKSR